MSFESVWRWPWSSWTLEHLSFFHNIQVISYLLCTVKNRGLLIMTTTMMMMMMMMISAASACRDLYCRRYEACNISRDGTPACQCPTASVCDGLGERTLCAGNGLTYTNRCLLRVDECAARRLIRILHPGPCGQGFWGRRPYRSRVWFRTGWRCQPSQLCCRELCVTFGIRFDTATGTL